VSQKTREKSVKKHPLFEPQSGEFGGFSFLNASFLSEAGAVLIFWYFFIKKKVQRINGVLIFFCFVFLYQDKKMKKHFIKKKCGRKNNVASRASATALLNASATGNIRCLRFSKAISSTTRKIS
jgi:hypothetical protein